MPNLSTKVCSHSTGQGRLTLAALIAKVKLIPYEQAKRKSGVSSYNVRRYFSFALNALVVTSTAPLRIAIILGLVTSTLSFVAGITYLVYKLVFWERFVAGTAPLLIGLFFFASVQMLFVGLLGEYIGAIFKKVSKTSPVIEKDLINF